MTFYQTITAAIADIAAHGYDSQERVAEWVRRIRASALETMTPPSVLEKGLRIALSSAYERTVDRGGALKANPGIERFSIERVKPKLRSELDRRIAASADLIKLNRNQAIEKTLQRFSGWATSIPPGGSNSVAKVEESKKIRKSLSGLSFEERRVAIDQGHKLVATINELVAIDSGALAAVWHSHWRQPGYNYRKDHKERDGRVYLIRGNWAQEKGLIKVGPAGYYDQITKPAEEVYCRCSAEYIHNLRDIPKDMLTIKGKEFLARAA
jgi:hypothetical protein